jgi:hypothetical protein
MKDLAVQQPGGVHMGQAYFIPGPVVFSLAAEKEGIFARDGSHPADGGRFKRRFLDRFFVGQPDTP